MAGKPFFVVPHALGTVTSGNELTTNPASHLGEHYFAGLTWKSAGNANLWARCNFGSAKEINFAGLLATNAVVATTARLRLGDTQAEVDGVADYDSTAQVIRTPAITDESGLYHWHWELPSLQTEQWARVDIGSHTGDFEAAMLVLGKKVQPATWYETEYDRGYTDLASLTINRFGVPDLTEGVQVRTLAFKMGWLTESEIETAILPMARNVGRSKPLFLCFDPDPTTYRQARTYFGFLQESPRPRKRGFNRFESQFEFVSII